MATGERINFGSTPTDSMVLSGMEPSVPEAFPEQSV